MKKRIAIFVTLMLFFTCGINVLEKSVYAQDNELETISITYTDNLTITLHKITSVEINELKQEIGVYKEGEEKNYSVIINGHMYYTGLRPPTEEEWSQIEKEGLIVDDISFSGILPSSVDHTIDPWFPPIGRQNAPSCTCWAVVYYVKTYQEAKEHGWDLSGAKWEGDYYNGHPSPAYQDKIMSPDFIYHQINGGAKGGSGYFSAINRTHQIGACSWGKMPQIYEDYNSFPSESAWREAPLFRGDSEIQYLFVDSDIGINKLKKHLANDRLAVTSIDHTQYGKLGGNNLWTVDNYEGGNGHANTVVGYNDNFGPYTEEGKVRYGAFRIVNSWGKNWGRERNGCYWISYEAMKKCVKRCMFFEDKIDYEPQLISVLQIDHPKRMECDITLGANANAKKFSFCSAGSLPFPNNKIVLDITELTDEILEIEGQKFFLGVYDRVIARYGESIRYTGNISYFSIEYYDDYDSGIPTITATSDDPPIKTIDNNEVIAELVVPSSNVRLYTDKQTYSVGENVKITLENNEDEAIYFATSSHWSIQKDVNGNWETIYPSIALQVITQLGPGETEESTWNQKDADGTQVGSGDYRVVTAYSMNDLTFTKYAYFSIVGYVINPLFVNTDKSIYVPDQNVGISVQNIGTNTLSLKKWYVEKKTLSGIWETIYESSIFFDYVILPINDTFVVTIPYNDTIVTIPVEEPIIVLPNETVGIWSDDAITIGNWTTISPIVGENSGISIIDSIDESNITGWTDNLIIVEDWAIESPVIGWTDESSGLINYTAISSSDIILTNQISANSDMDLQDVTFDFSPNEVVGIDNNLVTEQSLTFTEGENLVYSNPGTMLLPNQKLTWTWPQTTSDGGEPGFGEYRVKVEYDDSYATSSPFSITVIFTLPEEPIIWTPSINLTYNLTTEVSIGKISISETPTFVYNPSSAIPIIETIIGTDLNPSVVKIMTDVSTGKTTIEVNSVTATTIKSLIIDNSNLLMSTSLGYGEVKILPDMVKEKASLKSVKNIELKEYNNKPVYQVNGVRESKLLWFIPVDMDVTVNLNAETGSIEKTEKPWWGFLAS